MDRQTDSAGECCDIRTKLNIKVFFNRRFPQLRTVGLWRVVVIFLKKHSDKKNAAYLVLLTHSRLTTKYNIVAKMDKTHYNWTKKSNKKGTWTA